MVKLLEDKMVPVAIAAAGALRNVCVEGGAAAGRLLSSHKATASLLSLLTLLDAAFAATVNEKGRLVPADAAAPLHWYAITPAQASSLFTQVITLFTSLCEVAPSASDEFTLAQVRFHAYISAESRIYRDILYFRLVGHIFFLCFKLFFLRLTSCASIVSSFYYYS